jgi:hypothetical protein
MTTAAPSAVENPELTDARRSFSIQVAEPRVGVEHLFPLWQRWRLASARFDTVDPLEGVTFSDVVEAVLVCRIHGTALVLPAKGKGK